MHHAPQFPVTAATGEEPQTLIVGRDTAALRRPDTAAHVGDSAQLPRMTEDEREVVITRANRAIEHHMAIWASDGCMAARGYADRIVGFRDKLIAGRSPEVQARRHAEFEQRIADGIERVLPGRRAP